MFNKEQLNEKYNIIDVKYFDGKRPEKPNDLHKFDLPNARNALAPFNNCKIARVEIPCSTFRNESIGVFPRESFLGILCKQKDLTGIQECFILKGIPAYLVFPIL